MNSDPSDRQARVEARLREAFQPEILEIEDESHRHRGHPGAASGASHYRVLLVSSRFESCPPVKRHRMVYEALEGLMNSEVHALALQTLTPAEREAERPG
jgi:BolA protein